MPTAHKCLPLKLKNTHAANNCTYSIAVLITFQCERQRMTAWNQNIPFWIAEQCWNSVHCLNSQHFRQGRKECTSVFKLLESQCIIYGFNLLYLPLSIYFYLSISGLSEGLEPIPAPSFISIVKTQIQWSKRIANIFWKCKVSIHRDRNPTEKPDRQELGKKKISDRLILLSVDSGNQRIGRICGLKFLLLLFHIMV